VQPTSQVNYPQPDVPFTRITEYKHLPNQATESGRLAVPHSTLVREYSTDKGEPFYPVPAPANRALYERYKAATAGEAGVVFVGRLASYKYFNMDAAILNALECADVHVHGKGTVWPPVGA
jgi:UDP-galactopyranose mutase